MNPRLHFSKHVVLSLAFCTLGFAGCDRSGQGDGFLGKSSEADLTEGGDTIYEEVAKFQHETRSFYNTRNFDELEKRAAELLESKAKFGNGGWMIDTFYHSLRCRKEEPESMWQLHSEIHKEWEKAKPHSMTARMAHADFLVEYAWHARGGGYANSVTREGW